MSFLTGTQAELIYNMPAPGTAFNTGTAKTLINANSSSNPAYQLPPLLNIWQNSYLVGRGLRFVARGLYSTTGTPTLALVSSLDTTEGTGGISLASCGSVTTASPGVTNGMWEMEFDTTVSQVGYTGGAYTANVYAAGCLTLGGSATAYNAPTVAANMYAVGSGTALAIVPSTSYYVGLYATWSASSSSNNIQCTQFQIWGLD